MKFCEPNRQMSCDHVWELCSKSFVYVFIGRSGVWSSEVEMSFLRFESAMTRDLIPVKFIEMFEIRVSWSSCYTMVNRQHLKTGPHYWTFFFHSTIHFADIAPKLLCSYLLTYFIWSSVYGLLSTIGAASKSRFIWIVSSQKWEWYQGKRVRFINVNMYQVLIYKCFLKLILCQVAL